MMASKIMNSKKGKPTNTHTFSLESRNRLGSPKKKKTVWIYYKHTHARTHTPIGCMICFFLNPHCTIEITFICRQMFFDWLFFAVVLFNPSIYDVKNQIYKWTHHHWPIKLHVWVCVCGSCLCDSSIYQTIQLDDLHIRAFQFELHLIKKEEFL